MLDFLYQRFFCDLPIETFSDKSFKVLYHPHFDFSRFDFKEINVIISNNTKEFYKPNNALISGFLRFKFLTRDNTHYLTKMPQKALKHNQIYADMIVDITRSDYLKSCDSFMSHYHLERIIICRYNKFLSVGIPIKIIIPKIEDNFCNKKADSNIKIWEFNSDTLTEIQKNMEAIYSKREGDREIIFDYLKQFTSFSDEELVNAYNSQKAIYGVHRQILYLIAMDLTFKERFKKSPIKNQENIVFGLGGKILYLKSLKTFEQANEN